MKKQTGRKKKINYEKITSNRFIAFLVVILVLFSLVTLKIINVMFFEKDDYNNLLAELTHSSRKNL